MLRIFLLIALVFVQPARAEDEVPVPLSDQPDVPPKVRSGQPMDPDATVTGDPDVTIIRRGQETVEEFRRNNRVYKVVVTPAIGPSYTLYDRDNDGNLDVRESDLKTGLRINQWTLFSW